VIVGLAAQHWALGLIRLNIVPLFLQISQLNRCCRKEEGSLLKNNGFLPKLGYRLGCCISVSWGGPQTGVFFVGIQRDEQEDFI
jgi:hypothetical protein